MCRTMRGGAGVAGAVVVTTGTGVSVGGAGVSGAGVMGTGVIGGGVTETWFVSARVAPDTVEAALTIDPL